MCKTLIGDDGGFLDYRYLADVGAEILQTIRDWKAELGARGDLVDDYLQGILEAMMNSGDVTETAEEGFINSLASLRKLLLRVQREKDGNVQAHPFYPYIEEYLRSHAIPEDSLFIESCCVGLFPQYLQFAVGQFTQGMNAAFQREYDNAGVPGKREVLMKSGADITAEALDYFEHLIGRIFYVVPPSAIYVQGILDQLVLSLNLSGEQNEGYIFQRIINREI